MRSGVLLLAAAAACIGCAIAAAIPPPASPSSASDVQDLVFLGDTRPVFLRLHILVNGRPFQQVWEDYIRSLFQYLDRDGNGILTKAEGERAPSSQQLLQMMSGNILAGDASKGAAFSELDVDPIDGMVTPQKLAAYYRRSGAGPLQQAFPQDVARNEALNRVLFKHLDANKDGKLSKDELLAAADVLHRFDFDDDEMISETELLPAQTSFGVMPPPARASVQAVRTPNSFYVIGPGRAASGLAEQLLTKYDKDKDGRLSRSEIGLEPAAFDRLDANHDGQLETGELTKFGSGHPDIEIVIRIGHTAVGEERADLWPARGRAAPLASTMHAARNGTLLLTLGEAQVALHPRPEPEIDNQMIQARFVRQFYLQQFQLADPEKKGYLQLSKLKGPQFQFLRVLFPLADRDGDGKLTEGELIAFLDIQDRAARCATSLDIVTSGKSLFAILDANRDGRLGQRELRTAWSRLSSWDRNGDGLIAATELPQQFQLILGRGVAGRGRVFFGDGSVISGSSVPTKGPLWFRKMDRNGDGDVSPREFLGSAEDFRKIDTDHDGLIDAQEAAAAEKWLRKRLPNGQ